MSSEHSCALIGAGVATLHEVQGRRGLVSRVSLIVGEPFAGRAVTVALPAGDNLGVHLALAKAEPGTVLCIASAGQGSFGVFGELLMAAAKHREIVAVVTDDGVRDLAALDPPPAIAARAVVARGTSEQRLRRPVGAPVPLGGVLVESGDWLVGDQDGVFVVPGSRVDAEPGAGSASSRAGTYRGRPSGLRRAKHRGIRTSLRSAGEHHLNESRRAMRIIDIEVKNLRFEYPDSGGFVYAGGRVTARVTSLVFVHSDDGQRGIGAAYSHPDLVKLIVEQHIRPHLIGRDPVEVESSWSSCTT